jgi:iron complex outermembrane receptor protein
MTSFLFLLALLTGDDAKPVLKESIVVSGIRAEEKTPVTKTDIDKETIDKDYYGQDIPLLLRDVPSINTYTEAGVGGSGYSYITLRGISPTRINFTLDGVPLADSEDMGTYFADFPDLAHSLESIQVQRGVGTSTVGSPSFGGSINFESIALRQSPQTSAEVGAGSYGTKFATAAYQTGWLPSGFALYTRLSAQASDGWRDSSGVRQHNVFLSAAKTLGDSQLKLTGFSGHEYSQLAYLAVDRDTLKEDLRFNPFGRRDKDSFGYDLAQLQYIRANMTASVYYQRGYGWYDLQGLIPERVLRYGLDGLLLGGMVSASRSYGPVTANYGVHVNQFRRDHTRDTNDVFNVIHRDYSNYGTKGEANAFAKFNYDPAPWHLYADVQVRTTDFHYHGDVAIDPIRWTFFNPKVGARYDLSSATGVYASAGMSTREPTRNDLFQGEDNASFAHDLRAVKPERLIDLEAGWDHRTRTTLLKANVYAMEFHHEIASTGELSDIGLLLRRNVDRSYRRGIELEGAWQATSTLRLRGNANLSRNRINKWTQFYDVYDAAGNIVGSQPLVHRDVNPVLTPTVLLNQTIEWTPTRPLTLGATGRYVGQSYLDNTNDARFTTPSFFALETNVAYDLPRNMRVRLQVNNVLNNKRIWPSGYSYLFLTPQKTVDGISYYYPQATRNAVVMVEFAK